MSDAQPSPDPTLEEAAAWFARLNTRTVNHADLTTFRAWRATPANAAAYDQVERLWERAQVLSGDADILAATRQIRRRRSLREWLELIWRSIAGRPMISTASALAAGLLVMIASTLLLGPTTYRTAIGEQRVLRLADGSRLHLDTDSVARVHITNDRRDIVLVKGQAMFDVAHDTGRPFVVQAGDTRVQALGTRFDVRRFGDQVKVTLVEGRVEVRRGAGDQQVWSLRAGEQVMTSPTAKARQVDVTAATSWTKGQLVFRDVPLSAAIAEVNRYSQTPVTLDSPKFADERVSGVFDSDDTEAFVAAVTALHPLERTTAASGDIVLRDLGAH